jgi:prepilin-type N-terminal cleavage/methylation domain-containing protein
VEARRAVTLIELMVVVSIIGLLAMLLLPAIQSSRETARAARCKNNLRQIGVALLNYESVRKRFPKGAEGRYDRFLSPAPMFGMSWWADVLPFLEQTDVADELDRRGAHAGWVQLNAHNGELAHEFAPAFFFCPSSSIGRFVTAGSFLLAAPSYVGISGASSHDGFPETRVSPCCRSDGEISAGGVLVPNAVIRVREISDGLSNTLLVGEQSDFSYTEEGVPLRIDGGYPNGWITGTKSVDSPPRYGSSLVPAYNLVTVRYSLNEQRYDLPGIYRDRGANNPLLSPHSGIVHLLRCDGSVDAAADTMDVLVLKTLASRDDGFMSGKADGLRLSQ